MISLLTLLITLRFMGYLYSLFFKYLLKSFLAEERSTKRLNTSEAYSPFSSVDENKLNTSDDDSEN